MMRRLVVSAALASWCLGACSRGHQTLHGWPPSLGRLELMQLLSNPSTCSSGWTVTSSLQPGTDIYACLATRATGDRVASIYVAGGDGTVLSLVVGGPSWTDVEHHFDRIAPLLDPSVAAGLRESIPDNDHPSSFDELDMRWPNVRATLGANPAGVSIVWTLRDFWPK